MSPAPEKIRVERNPHGTGYAEYDAYIMPERDPNNIWAAITSYDGAPVPCPVEGCDHEMVWYEAGYVPGYRVCMAPTDSGAHLLDSIRHRFVLDHAREHPGMVLIRSTQYED
jgi:hypothetical protein